MDFDGFLVLLRMELDGVERAAAPLWELAAGREADAAPFTIAAAADETRA